MPALASPAPPLSVRGTLSALRPPTAHDWLFSTKSALAAILSLIVAFSQDLQNPYWSALTVYVLVSQPQAGAVRSKALFRLVGTLLGGLSAILLAGWFGGDVGALIWATIAAIVLATYFRALDRTPASYAWFVFALTLAVTAIAQAPAPEAIFAVSTTRMVEIGLAVLATGLVDSVVFPSAETPDFLRSMADWRDRAGQLAVATLGPDARQSRWREDLLRLTGFLGPFYGLSTQLPWDIIATPPRGRDLRFLRLTIAHLVARLAAADVWIEAARREDDGAFGVRERLGKVSDWLLERAALKDPAILHHANRGDDLKHSLAALAAVSSDSDDLVRATALLRLSELVDHWTRLERTMYAIASGTPLAPALRAAASRARPATSTDYVLGLLDAAPMALALGFIATLWYFTAWTSAISAMLFVFISLSFVGGTPGALRSAQGIVLWIALTCALSLFYQFAVLPRVTDFAVLLAVLLAGLLPLGVFMTMSPAGLLIIANGLALIALGNGYAGDFGATLDNALGALAGCIIAVAALHVCQFDRARFSARRLASGLQQGLLDAARARRAPDLDRLISLSVDRLALYAGIVGGLPEGDPLRQRDAVAAVCAVANLLRPVTVGGAVR